MPVLGTGGRLRLKREEAAPVKFTPSDLDANGTLAFSGQQYWSGDEVKLTSPFNLPFFDDNGIPLSVDTVATYFDSRLFLAQNRDQITALSDDFYKKGAESYPADAAHQNDAAFFYYQGDGSSGVIEPPPPGSNEIIGYISITPLGRLKLYDTRCEALAGCGAGVLDRWQYGGKVLGWNEITMAQDNFNWEVLCGIQDYEVEFDAPNIETTAVGEKFGESVKSLVNGGGSCNFFIDRECLADGVNNSTELMQLLMMTEKGCKAEAEFYLLSNPGKCPQAICGPIPGSLYYKASILVTQVAINVRPTEMLAGTCQWVTTGEIKLLQESV